MGSYLRPETYAELLECLSKGSHTILAGGTDIYPGYVGKQVPGDIIDVTNIPDLSAIKENEDSWTIGATASWSDIISAQLPVYFNGLKLAATEVGGKQIQNSGTIGGNICNASPAADCVPPLLALNAEVEVAGNAGKELIPLQEFITGNRKTALQENQIVIGIHIKKKNTDNAYSHFLKLGARKYLVISIAMAAARLAVDDRGFITAAAISVGACSAVARRLGGVENKLIGRPTSSETFTDITGSDLHELTPIDDVRAPAEYRLDAAAELVRRALLGCLGLEGQR